MMYCPRCGRELPENGQCACGAQSAPAQQPPPPVDPAYTYPPDAPSSGGYIPPGSLGGYAQPLGYADPPAVAALRGLGSSPLMLCLCILFSAYFLSTFPAMLLQPSYGFEYYADAYGGQFSFNAPLSVSSLTTVIGLWLLYAACRKAQGPISTAGITVLKVFFLISAIASLVFLSLLSMGLLVVPAALAVLMAAMPANLSIPPETLAALIVVLGVVAIALIAYVIISMVFTLKTLNGIRDVARSGMPNHKTSMVLIVFLFLQGFALAVSAPFDGAAFFSPLIGAAAYVMLAIVLLYHRKNMKTVTMQNAVGGYIPPMPPQNF